MSFVARRFRSRSKPCVSSSSSPRAVSLPAEVVHALCVALEEVREHAAELLFAEGMPRPLQAAASASKLPLLSPAPPPRRLAYSLRETALLLDVDVTTVRSLVRQRR